MNILGKLEPTEAAQTKGFLCALAEYSPPYCYSEVIRLNDGMLSIIVANHSAYLGAPDCGYLLMTRFGSRGEFAGILDAQINRNKVAWIDESFECQAFANPASESLLRVALAKDCRNVSYEDFIRIRKLWSDGFFAQTIFDRAFLFDLGIDTLLAMGANMIVVPAEHNFKTSDGKTLFENLRGEERGNGLWYWWSS